MTPPALLSARLANDGRGSRTLNAVQTAALASVAAKITTGEYRFESAPCLLCGGDGDDLEPLAEKDRFGLEMHVVICRRCGLVQTSPRMDEDSYRRFYDDEYRPLYGGHRGPTASFFLGQREHGLSIVRWLRDVGQLPPSGSTVVEVGCGAGGNLAAFAELGYRVVGIDLGRDFVEFGRDAQGLDLRVGTVHDLDVTDVALVVYSHVFEHLLDPVAELAAVSSLLGRDGRLYIEVPGIRNLGRYRHDLLDYLQNAHVTHLSLPTLRALAARGGFRLLDGDEVVRAVFARGAADDESAFGCDDYDDTMRSLRSAERQRPIRRWRAPGSRLRRRLRVVRRLGLRRALDDRRASRAQK